MIRRSRLVVIACAGAALALHGTGLWLSGTAARIEVAGGAGAMEATLGSSFADMVTGAAQPVTQSTVTPNRQAEAVMKPVVSRKAPRPDTPRTAEAAPPDDSEARAPQEGAETPPTPRAGIAAVPSVETVVPTRRPVETPAAPPTGTAESADDPAPVPPTPATESARAAPLEMIEAQPEEEGVQVSRRPRARPREIEEAAARPSPEPERHETRLRRQQGNSATRDATRGSTAGTDAATATEQGRDTARRSDEQGNAAVSNYPGEVIRHLARVPRPRATSRGAALVQFSIAAGGGLASVGLSRSSGSSRLDRAALAVIERAAPFPAPPPGARRSFSIRIEGR
ncbi:gram-negative bacterial tonB protein [Roseovarius sp. A-2]|uniref:TonB family protein n=1 Tax=Roseovarius sp. A-2 TaxID=1570360 RepID=UPI0009B513EE|nr:TonB family protein [Roseovarius sp. A-2]GAW34145.1 gram-negative bacterial tonB protein [Roseovarius sp. A-2]